MNREQRQAVALAGVFQAAAVVDELARTGQYDQRAWETLIKATVDPEPETFDAIFGNDLGNMDKGISVARKLLDEGPQGSEVMRYTMSILLLTHRLGKNPEMLDTIAQRLGRIKQQSQHFGPTHENSVLALGQLYQDTLSTLRFRIVVQGNPSLMASPQMAERIRAILLCGIRFAMLWRHEGGRRWQLLLMRGRIKNALASLH